MRQESKCWKKERNNDGSDCFGADAGGDGGSPGGIRQATGTGGGVPGLSGAGGNGRGPGGGGAAVLRHRSGLLCRPGGAVCLPMGRGSPHRGVCKPWGKFCQ